MLIPLTREAFQNLIPLTATAEQYKHCWGKPQVFLKRLLISVGCAMIIALIEVLNIIPALNQILLIVLIVSGLYWFWGPVLEATLQNRQCRQYPYSGFWQGKILDIYITEEVTEEQESVNKRGELIIIDNLERRINVEVGDSTGFIVRVQAPLNRNHKRIHRGQVAQLIVMSYLEDLSRINQVSDLYIPSQNLWVSDYPYVQRDAFIEISRKLRSRRDSRPPSRSESRYD